MAISLGGKTLEEMRMDTTEMEMRPVTILGDYRKNGASGVLDIGCFSAEELKAIVEAGMEMVNASYDGWRNAELSDVATLGNSSCCTSCMKKLDDGSVIMGRNMDLPVSYAPAAIFRTKGDGKTTYDTVGIHYSSPGTISFDQITEIGEIPAYLACLMACICSDSLNSEGLYIEINMRESTECLCESTNPDADTRVAVLMLVRLMSDHCATIEEALEYLKTLDIYDSKAPSLTWSLAFNMMDKTGRYGVLEFYNNKMKWLEGRPGFACGHANFFLSKDTGVHHGSGLGRWQKLMEYHYDIETQEDMAQAMQQIWYSNLYTAGAQAKNWKANWVPEANDVDTHPVRDSWLPLIYGWRDQYGIEIDQKHLKAVMEIEERQEAEGGPAWTIEYLQDPANYYDVITVMNLVIKCFDQLPIDGQKASGFMEISSISYTASNKELGYNCHFFEMDDMYHIGLNETTIDRHPCDRKVGDI